MIQRFRDEDGVTLTELLVYMGLLGLVTMMVLGSLTSTQFNVQRELSRTDSNDQLRLAIEAMDREIRSSDLLYNPTNENYASGDIVSGYSMRVFSEANVPTRGGKRCVQYRITSGGELERRDWDPAWSDANDPTQVSSWRTLATGIQNRAQNTPAFTLAKINLINIELLANSDVGNGPISGLVPTVSAQDSISGRNSTIVSDLHQCGPDVPDPSQSTADGQRVPPY